MNVDEGVRWLDERGISEQYWVVGGLGSGDCYGIRRIGEAWEVYWSEHGIAKPDAMFDKEADAVALWLRQIATMRRVPGPNAS